MSNVAVATKGSTIAADMRLASTIAGGDREAFAALMRRFNGRLYHTARSIVTNDLGAESVVESAWLQAYRTIRNFNGETTLSIWLMRIVIGEALVRLPKGSHTGLECNQHLVQSRRHETPKRTLTSNVSPISAG